MKMCIKVDEKIILYFWEGRPSILELRKKKNQLNLEKVRVPMIWFSEKKNFMAIEGILFSIFFFLLSCVKIYLRLNKFNHIHFLF